MYEDYSDAPSELVLELDEDPEVAHSLRSYSTSGYPLSHPTVLGTEQLVAADSEEFRVSKVGPRVVEALGFRGTA